jgi:hypothetical protein
MREHGIDISEKWPTQKLPSALGAVIQAVIPTSLFKIVDQLCRKQRRWFNLKLLEQQG